MVVLNSLNFFLSEKHFIPPSILNEILVGYSNLGCRFFPSNTLNISCHSLLGCRVSAKWSAIKCMGFPFYVTCCFSLAAFNILSLCLVFVNLNSMSWCVSPWVYPVWNSLCLLDLIDYFLFHVGENFNYNLFKIFSYPLFFSSSSGTPIIWMLVHLILSQKSLRLSPVFSILFTLFCSSEVIVSILSSSSLICSSVSDILLLIPSRVFLISVIVLFVSVCLFFFFFLKFFLILFFNFTIFYWFCHISTWICHRYTRVPHPEPSSLLPPRTIPLGHPSAPAPSIQYHASNLDWRLVS